MTDVWAQAAQKTAAQNSTTTQRSDGGTNGGAGTPVTTPVDMANPFATQQQAAAAAPGGGGQWDYRVPFQAIEGRMVIMVPKTYQADAKDPFNEGETREEFRVDLIVLDGGPLTYKYNFKASKDAESVEKTMEVSEFPYVARGQGVAQGALIRALKGAEKEGKFIYGVLRQVAQKADLGKYASDGDPMGIDGLAQARKDWIAALSAGDTSTKEPRKTWGLDDRPQALTSERINLAAAWWEKEKATRLADAS